MINSIIPENWNKILIQGKLHSGKSQFSLWILDQIIKREGSSINRLLDTKESVLFLTEKVDQVAMNNHNLLGKIHTVENISSKNALQTIEAYHENFYIEIVVIDYINLLNYQSSRMKEILAYLNNHSIKSIFIENTHKLLKPDLNVYHEVDFIIETNRIGSKGIEAIIKKQNTKESNVSFIIEYK